jgi:hypothetical protein
VVKDVLRILGEDVAHDHPALAGLLISIIDGPILAVADASAVVGPQPIVAQDQIVEVREVVDTVLDWARLDESYINIAD